MDSEPHNDADPSQAGTFPYLYLTDSTSPPQAMCIIHLSTAPEEQNVAFEFFFFNMCI